MQNSTVFLASFVSKALSPFSWAGQFCWRKATTGKDYACLCYSNVVFFINKVNLWGIIEFEIIFCGLFL